MILKFRGSHQMNKNKVKRFQIMGIRERKDWIKKKMITALKDKRKNQKKKHIKQETSISLLDSNKYEWIRFY